MRRTTSCVSDGVRVKSYSQGTSKLGSLPMKAYIVVGSELSSVKKLSSRAVILEPPPRSETSAPQSNGAIQVYCAESPSAKPDWPAGLKPLIQAPEASRG